MRALAFVALALLACAPAAWAQEHGHANENGVAMVLHDGPDDGRAVVGAYTHFGFALQDKHGAPVEHQDAAFRLVQDGVTLFSTTDTHEYDGLFGFDVRFARPGPYQVFAESGDMTVGVFEGEAVLPVNASGATIAFEAAPLGLPGTNAVQGTVSVLDPSGAILPHTDVVVEFREASDDALYARTHLHIHDAPIEFVQGFGLAREYVAHVVATKTFATGRGEDVPAVVASFPVSVGAAAPPALPPFDPTPPEPLAPTGASAEGAGMRLHAMYDPQNQVGVGQTARLAALVVDAMDGRPAPHVDFSFTLRGPRGTVFASESIHEYDGMFEYLFVPEAPGVYTAELTARRGEGEVTVPYRLHVLPGFLPAVGGTGPIAYAVEGLEGVAAGTPAELTFSAKGPAGPAKHSEVDVTVFAEGEPPLYQFKLHTHDSGLTKATLVFPNAGAWKLRIDGLPTVPEPSVYPTQVFVFDVAEGVMEGMGEVAAAADEKLAVPGAAPWLALLLGAGLIAFARRP